MIWRAFGWMDTLEDVTLRNGLTNTVGKIWLLESYQVMRTPGSNHPL